MYLIIALMLWRISIFWCSANAWLFRTNYYIPRNAGYFRYNGSRMHIIGSGGNRSPGDNGFNWKQRGAVDRYSCSGAPVSVRPIDTIWYFRRTLTKSIATNTLSDLGRLCSDPCYRTCISSWLGPRCSSTSRPRWIGERSAGSP